MLLLMLLAGCGPDTVDTGHDSGIPSRWSESPREWTEPGWPDSTKVDTSAIDADPCATPPVPPAFPSSLWCGSTDVSHSGFGGPLPDVAGICGYPAGDYATYQPTHEMTVWIDTCSASGRVVVFDGDGVCYGAAHIGQEWAVHVLPGMTIGITGGGYALEAVCP